MKGGEKMDKKLKYVVLDEENKNKNFLFSGAYEIFYQINHLNKDQYQQTLVISKKRDKLEEAQKANIAVLGVETEPTDSFLPCKLVVERLDLTTAGELNKAFCREKEIPLIVMETKRLLIREIEKKDMDALYQLYQGEEVNDFVDKLHEDRELEAAYISDYIRLIYRFYDLGMWMLWDKETGKIIGRAGVEPMEYKGKQVLELGYIIGKESRQKGYAREACEAILEYVKSLEEYQFVDAVIYSGNSISMDFIKTLGFEIISEEMKGKKRAQRWRKILHF
jgi:RimJ/RimL family protein N-acetyltransferase